ncbi:28S ribosomal protein S18c, mitochondrial-like isoform X2 [Otolemur garnettii]|uniref:28S ribosomal protein S18c, mitochondrial-like isoform X2 n=1 Tax=Otolemur garnettii TaxID=30611 RepID=UPI0006441D85|nr:28S ribosomal protein S18c, mitochondrial-like isoform X2 [Otolemur garnettii]
MAAMVCSILRRKKLTSLVTASVCFMHPATHSVLWSRGCSQYKRPNVQLLSQFISPFTGCIYGKHITGLCGKKQKEITKAIKRAQIMGFMPITYKDPAYLKDPKVCNIKYRE